jgi:hypothetical protein
VRFTPRSLRKEPMYSLELEAGKTPDAVKFLWRIDVSLNLEEIEI